MTGIRSNEVDVSLSRNVITGHLCRCRCYLGWHFVHAAQHEAEDTVVAFEPDQFNAWLLDRNLSLNGIDNAVLSTCAVVAQRGLVRLHRYKGSNLARHSILADYGFGSRIVPITDLDSALGALRLSDQPLLILKIDVEGYEPAVVAGVIRTVSRTDVVITEYSPALSRLGGLSTDEMLGLSAFLSSWDIRVVTEFSAQECRNFFRHAGYGRI